MRLQTRGNPAAAAVASQSAIQIGTSATLDFILFFFFCNVVEYRGNKGKEFIGKIVELKCLE